MSQRLLTVGIDPHPALARVQPVFLKRCIDLLKAVGPITLHQSQVDLAQRLLFKLFVYLFKKNGVFLL